MNFKTQEDLDRVLSKGKNVNIIKTFWIDVEKGKLFNAFTDSIKDTYETTYSSIDTNDLVLGYINYKSIEDGEPIVDINGMVVLDANGEPTYEVVYTYEDSNYETVEVTEFDENGTEYVVNKQVLTTEAQTLVDAGKVRPTLDYYAELETSKFLEDTTNLDVDMVVYVTFIKPVLLKMTSATFEKAIRTITDAYPEHEQKTWDKQEIEAKAYSADNTVATPLLDGIVTVRGVDKYLLVTKIIEKAIAFTSLSGIAIGFRQKAEDLITSVTTVAELDIVLSTLEQDRTNFYNMF